MRSYQNQAIDAWFAHECQGLLEMATGTGKTITALAASIRLFEQENRLAVIIAAPISTWWISGARKPRPLGISPFLAYKNKSQWLEEFNHTILDFVGGFRNFVFGDHHA
ncbi:MAG: DEAD/DEAH box helicase family protein [Caldilineaceae bacterium]